jgi:prepilin-type N-terminal cleavage/methylation domain-containing protein
MNSRSSQPRGFTMLELLVVVAVMAVLIGMLLPVLRKIQDDSRKTVVRTHLSNLQTAINTYEFDFGFYPPDSVVVNGKTLTGSASLHYHLTTAFRVMPTVERGEVKASRDVGPLFPVTDAHQKTIDGVTYLVDLYGRPLHYDNVRDDVAGNGFNSGGADDPRTYEAPLNAPRNNQSYDLFSFGPPTTTPAGRQPIAANFKCGWEGK